MPLAKSMYLLPRQIVQGGALPVVNVHWKPPVGMHHIGLIQGLQF